MFKVRKRNNTLVDYDLSKIVEAASKASHNKEEKNRIEKLIKYHFSEQNIDNLCSYNNTEEISVERLQDMVEQALMMEGLYDVAKNYIIYREKKNNLRFIVDKLKYMDNYSTSNNNPAVLSNTDANANMSQKNVATSEIEVYKDTNRLIQRQRQKENLNKMYPEEGLGKKYIDDLENNIIYTHDEASSPERKYYCKAVTMYPLTEGGTFILDGTRNKAPQHLTSFCDQFVNTVFNLSSQCKGAVGFGEFFNYFDYYCAKDFGPEYHLLSDKLADSEFVASRKTIGEKIDQAFQCIVYNINQAAYGRGQSPFTNFNIFDSYYWHALFDIAQFPDGTKPVWERVDWIQKRFLKWFNDERTKCMLTFPVISFALLNDGNKPLDEEYEDLCADTWVHGGEQFCLTLDNPEAISSCCRLRNNITDNTFSSVNGMTGVQTGSVNVITLNLNRIAQNFVRENSSFKYSNGSKLLLLDYITSILERVYKYHISYKTMLYEHEKNGMFSSCNAGYISLDRLYSTIGVNGFNEMAEFLGFTCSNNEPYKEFCYDICSHIKKQNAIHSTNKFRFNFEFVPAESLGVKNYNRDKADGYWVPEDRFLYNAYFYIADDPNTTIFDKFIMHGGKINDCLDGGQAVHINLEEHLTKDQYKDIIRFNIKNKCSYWTFNVISTECLDCGAIVKRNSLACPKCNSENTRHWTKPVGYIRPIEGFGEGRRQEAERRYRHKLN